MKRLTTNIIPPDGPLNAKICFILEAPGEEEDLGGKPAIGTAGQFFDRCITSKGLLRSEVLVHNVFTQRPPNNKVNYYFQDKSNKKPTWEGEEHIEELRKWLRTKVKSNLIVSCGGPSTYILTGKYGITKWRGSVLPCTLVEGFKVYPTFHPSYVQRLMQEEQETKLFGEKKKKAQNALPLFLRDIERILIQSEFPEIQVLERKFEIDLSLKEILEKLDYLTQNQVDCAVDIETLPDETGPILWCIGFSPFPSDAFTIPFIKGRRFAWSTSEEAKITNAISRYFLSNAKKIFQNGGYDLAVLGRYYGLRVKEQSYDDTMWLHQSSYPYIRKGLANLTSIYTWEPYYKDDGKVHFGKRSADSAEFIYNCKDCCVTREIFPILRRDAQELRTYEGYHRTIDNLPSHLAMTLRGVKINLEAKENLSNEFKSKAAEYQSRVESQIGTSINLNSSDQVRKLLYGFLGLDIQYNRSTGKATTDKEARQKLIKKYRGSSKGEVVNWIDGFKKFSKLSSAYASMELDTDGRARTSYGYVSTWRTNSFGSPFVFNLKKKSQAGGNLQQIPVRTEEGRMIRKLFIPDEGKEMLACDLAQAEAVCVAYEAEDLVKINQFLDDSVDAHWEYAKTIFDIPPEVKYLPKAKFRDRYTNEDHTLKELRDLGKTTRHATNYDEGPFKFQASLVTFGFHLPYSTCKKILYKAKSDPMLMQWKRGVREKLRANGYLDSSIGDRRYSQARMDDDTFRAFYAFSPQNTVGRILQIAIQRIHSECPYVDCLLNVHDEVVTQIYPKDRARAIKDIRERMEQPIEIHGRTMTIRCDFKVGPNWGELKEI